ncbi:unnamed protein product [Pieris macdunnoughi]|uniref:Peroxisomal leader peptide-processing protease n=1 Tax=Pieris macdunnoughi TaxID=345717 RepID=A0A821NHJ1_9NEOP|nr:unnamed protein product [Pieris macdunnoughi]
MPEEKKSEESNVTKRKKNEEINPVDKKMIKFMESLEKDDDSRMMSFFKGESVLAAGYPYFNENNLEDLKPTVTSGHVNNVSPSLIQTSCCVQSGFSGGPIFRISNSNKVEVLGIIASNAKTETGACYPYINMAVPTRAFLKIIQHFILDRDETRLSTIENNREMIQSQWRLLPYRSKI